MSRVTFARRGITEQRMIAELVRGALARHKTDDGIMAMLAAYDVTDIRELPAIKRLVRELEHSEVGGRTNMDVFLDYRREQLDVIKDLDEFVEDINKGEAHKSAIPTALRAKSDIIERILKAGQDLGVISRKPLEGVLLGGIVVGELDDNAIREKANEIQGRFAELTGAVSRGLLPAGFKFTKTPEEVEGAVCGEPEDDDEDDDEKRPLKRDPRKRPIRRRPT